MEMWERDSFEQYYANRRAKEKANFAYFFAQKLCGIVLIGLTIMCWVFVNEYTASTVFLMPLGVYLLFTRQKVMDFQKRR